VKKFYPTGTQTPAPLGRPAHINLSNDNVANKHGSANIKENCFVCLATAALGFGL
jgi:hypothetical protein